MNHNMIIFVCSTPPDNLSIQEFQKNEAIDVEVKLFSFKSGKYKYNVYLVKIYRQDLREL